MNELRSELKRLLAAAKDPQEEATAPFGFAARMVALARARTVESPLFLAEALVRRAAAAAFLLALAVTVACFATGVPRLEADALSRPYQAVYSMAK